MKPVPRLVPASAAVRRRAPDRAKHLPVGDAPPAASSTAPAGCSTARPARTQETRRRRGHQPARTRAPIAQLLDVGIRAINALLTVGRGQRLACSAGSGRGQKSALIGMMARYTEADAIVVGLIGERGPRGQGVHRPQPRPRGPGALGRMAARRHQPADAQHAGAATPPRWRNTSATRRKQVLADHGLADALRDGAARDRARDRRTAGHPRLPAERVRPPAGAGRAPATGRGGGSITAFYTIAAEGDDQQDPIADSARHPRRPSCCRATSPTRVTTRPSTSSSRSRGPCTTSSARPLRRGAAVQAVLLALPALRDLIAVGAYQPGGDPLLDMAVKLYPRLEAFLQQGIHEHENLRGCRRSWRRCSRERHEAQGLLPPVGAKPAAIGRRVAPPRGEAPRSRLASLLHPRHRSRAFRHGRGRATEICPPRASGERLECCLQRPPATRRRCSVLSTSSPARPRQHSAPTRLRVAWRTCRRRTRRGTEAEDARRTIASEYHEFSQAARRPERGRMAQLWRLHRRLTTPSPRSGKVVEQSRARTVEGQQAWLAQRTKLKPDTSPSATRGRAQRGAPGAEGRTSTPPDVARTPDAGSRGSRPTR